MADFNIQPIGAQIKPMQGMSLADMINVARGAQAFQQAELINPLAVQQQQQQARTGEIALSVEEQKNKERLNMQQVMTDPTQYMTDGKYDPQKAIAIATKVAPLTGLSYLKDMAGTFGAQSEAEVKRMQAEKAGVDLNKYYTDLSRNIYGGLLADPAFNPASPNPKLMEEKLDAAYDVLTKGFNVPKSDNPMHDQIKKLIRENPVQAIQTLKNGIFQAAPGQTQAELLARQPTAISSGAGTVMVPTSPFQQGQPPGFIEQQVPPTQEIIDPATGERKLVGPITQRQQQPMVTGAGPVQAGALEAQGTVIKEDLPRTIAEAKDAPARIGIFQNIKKLTPEAFTGPTAERRQAVASFAQMLGMPAYTLETASTDELMKNTKLLQLAGGNTDAARALAEFANPNNKMTKEGIERVTDQLIGIEKMREARAKYLVPFQNNAAEYLKRKQDFDSISDPRLFQEMSREDAVKMWKSMSPAQQAEILDMQRKAKNLGVIK